MIIAILVPLLLQFPLACRSSTKTGLEPSTAETAALSGVEERVGQREAKEEESPSPSPKGADGPYERLRNRMVEEQLVRRDIQDPKVLEAMRKVPRHRYVPADLVSRAYNDSPLPIGRGQTISQPYIVAFMTQALELTGEERVLEIGTGSGYQAAVLGELVKQVYSIELLCPLAEQATSLLDSEGYQNITVRCGDGYKGWPEEQPFDAIMVTAAPPKIPQALVDQLKPGGRMVVPVGVGLQVLRHLTRNEDGQILSKDLLPVRFVPMVPGKD